MSKQRFLGGLLGANPLRSIPESGDEHWSDVGLLISANDNTVVDSSSSNVSLTTTGATPGQTSSPYSSGYSTNFDGASDYVTFTGPDLSGDFTIEMWYRPAAVGSDQILLDLRNGSTSWCLLQMDYAGGNAANTLRWYDNSGWRLSGDASVVAGTWYHVAIVRDAGVQRLYIDGVDQGDTYSASTDYSGQTVVWGASWLYGIETNGNMTDLRITSVARDIAADWAAGVYTSALPQAPAPFTDATTTTVTNTFGTDDGAEEVTYYASTLAGANDQGGTWGPGGTTFYWVADSGSTWKQVDCTTAYDLTTAGTPDSVTPSGGTVTNNPFFFNDDGTQVMYSNNSLHSLRYRTMSTPYDITTIGSESSVASIGYYLSAHLGDNGNLYLVSRDNTTSGDGDVRTFSDPSDFSSSLTNQKQLDSGVQYNQTGDPFRSAFNDDGTVMWLALTGDYAGIEELHLSTPYDPTSVTKANNITVPIDTAWTASSGASEIKSLQYANGVLWVVANNGGRKLYKFPISETVASSVDRTTANVGILSLDEVGPEANSGVVTFTVTDIGPNYILASEDLDNATYWTPTTNMSAVEDTTVNGILMHKIQASASQSYGRVYQTVTGLSLATATTATLSVYVKEGTSSDNHCLRVDTAGNSGGFNFAFKFVGGVPTKDAGQTTDFTNYALGTETIEDVGGGLWRITVPFTNNSGSTQSTHVVHTYGTWNTANTNSVYFGGVQLVEGGDAGDYAKTTTTTVNATVTTAGAPETRELTPFNWGGIRGRDALPADTALANTGILSLSELLQASYGLAPTSVTASEYLLVAGGGGGGIDAGGGGGAGGYLVNTSAGALSGTYTVTIGAGGAAAVDTTVPGSDGAASTISGTGISATAVGGGGGGSSSNINGRGGGSGGGARRETGTPGSAVQSGAQGNDGGAGSGATRWGGGGGGAGAAGSTGTLGHGGDGVTHAILNAISHGEQSGVDYYVAGGGGGANDNDSTNTVPGGLGGGGTGSGKVQTPAGSNGTANTGGGGGGGRPAAYDGGSGVAIIKTDFQATGYTGSCTETQVGNDWYYLFTGDGTVTFP